MPRIEALTIETAHQAARPTLEALKNKLGMVPNLFATIAHSPAALSALLAFDGALAGGTLTSREIELVNLYTSELNGCAYCVSAHGTIGKGAGLSPEEIDAARRGVGKDARENAVLALVQRVVRTGGAHAGKELEQAKNAGLKNADIIQVLGHVASKTFTNAVGLLAQVEIDFPKQPNLPRP